MQEDVLEIRAGRPQDAMELLREQPGILEVALFGRTLHAVVEDAEKATPAIRDVLAHGGFDDPQIHRIRPSLEDVFVSLIEARDRQEAAFEVKQ
jgi:ABC-2 type transport system ATP-binding protein